VKKILIPLIFGMLASTVHAEQNAMAVSVEAQGSPSTKTTFIASPTTAISGAEQKAVVVSVEAKGFSSTMTTLIGNPTTMTSGEVQSASSQAHCMIVHADKSISTIGDLSKYASGTTIAVLPIWSDAMTVRAYVSFSSQVQKEPKVEVIDENCTLATGVTSATTVNQLATFEWGISKSIGTLNGRPITVEINDPSLTSK